MTETHATGGLPRRYDHAEAEPRLQAFWQEVGVYHYAAGDGPAYAIDTPPPTVSGHLHLGHVYSYSHTDFLARFWRMNGHRVFYPMGYDDNGLPTERLVERVLGITVQQVGREAFIARCLEASAAEEQAYQQLWLRLGLSVDWRYTYRTIDTLARRTAQVSFLDLYRRGLAYRQVAPTIWCPECRTAIAQAEINDLERESTFYTLAFRLPDGTILPIATTRPELLPACVAVFVHPQDSRYAHLAGQQVAVPLAGRSVPLLVDPQADPAKGTGAVMCCTFGDAVDVEWWRAHGLPLRAIMGRDGRLTEDAGELAGLSVAEARRAMVATLAREGALLGQSPVSQSVRVHERCDTPVEYIVTPQWYVRLLDFKAELLAAGEQVRWHPPYMLARYREWVENLRWDWAISRQRTYGVAFPVWYCAACGAVLLADDADLPVDPTAQPPPRPCACGCAEALPELDVMDTWATSSLSPQIAGRWLQDPALYQDVFPMSLRPQAHDIIRTWAFYTIAKSHHHFHTIPWAHIAISGWGIAGEGMGKISKSRGGGPMPPLEMIERYSADAVRYWAASTGLGKDAVINEEKIQAGAKLAIKLWNVARFSERFLAGGVPPEPSAAELSPADRWLLSRLQRLARRATDALRDYDYATAKAEVEAFFWRDLADNYLEMAKKRLYEGVGDAGARWALHQVLLTTIKLFAPFLPHITEEIYQGLFRTAGGPVSVHVAAWPAPDARWESDEAERVGETLVEVATAVRRFKSEQGLALGAEVARVYVTGADAALAAALRAATSDLISITRAREIVVDELPGAAGSAPADGLRVLVAQ